MVEMMMGLLMLYRSMITLMPMGDFFYEQSRFADQFNVLQLTDGELAILSAVVILNPGQ